MTVPLVEVETIYKDLIRKWIAGNDSVRSSFPGCTDLDQVRQKIRAFVEDELYNQVVFANYQFPFGFTIRMVGTEPIGKSVNRPFENDNHNKETKKEVSS